MLPIFVNEVLLEHNYVHSRGYFCIETAQLGSCKTDFVICNIYYLALYKNFVDWDLNHCLIDIIGNLPEVV